MGQLDLSLITLYKVKTTLIVDLINVIEYYMNIKSLNKSLFRKADIRKIDAYYLLDKLFGLIA